MVGVAFDWCLHNTGFGVVKLAGMAAMMTVEQFQQFMQHLIPTIQNQFLQQTQQQPPGDGGTTITPSGRKVTIHPKCYSRLDKYAGGEEKWRKWSYDFRGATATQNATVFEILNWIEENGEHTFRGIMATDPERIRDGGWRRSTRRTSTTWCSTEGRQRCL